MAITAYNFKRTDGTTLGPVFSLESNGPGAESVPLQLSDIDFSVTPIELIVSGDLVERFPQAVINRATVTDYSTVDRYFAVAGDFTYSEQLLSGGSLVAFDLDGTDRAEFTIVSVERDGGDTVIYVNEPIGGTLAYSDLRISTIRWFDLAHGAYDGHYYVNESGSHIDANGRTRIPLHTLSTLATPSFDIVGVSTGASGSFAIEGAANGSCLFNPGSTMVVTDNDLPSANKSYIVSAVDTSGTYTIVATSATSITVAGDQRKFFINNRKISVSNQSYRVELTTASAVLTSGNTVITTVEPVPSTIAVTGSVVCSPSITVVTVIGTVPVGAAADGLAEPALPVSFNFSAPPAITPTTPHNFLITWRIAGDHTATFSSGCPVLIKGNGFYEYQEFPIQSVSLSSGMTHIVTQVSEPTSITPSPDAAGQLVYPAPSNPPGYLQYSLPSAYTPLKLIGKGAPTFNSVTTWGQALQDNTISLTENFATGINTPVLAITFGVNGQFKIRGDLRTQNQLKPGADFEYYGDSYFAGQPDGDMYTISDVDYDGHDTIITVAGTIPAVYDEDGSVRKPGDAPTAAMEGQLWYDRSSPQLYAVTNETTYDTESHGVVIQTVPALEFVDMGQNKIIFVEDANQPQDAVNLRTADKLYIAKTGGANMTNTVRSGQMFGSLNFGSLPVGAPDELGINLTNAQTRLYGTAGVELDVDGSGDIRVAGTGNVLVDVGNVTVGTGIDNIVMQNNPGDAPTLTFTTSTNSNAVVNLGSNKIVNMSTPTAPTDGANKAYVDGLANGIVWLQPVLDPNLFDDTLSAPPFITASVVSATTGAANIWKIVGNYASSFSSGAILTITDNTFLAANKAYVVVSATNNGANTDITVAASTIPVGVGNNGTATDTSVAMHKTYIVKAPATGDWVGLDDHVVTYAVTAIDPVTQVQTWGWLDILGRAVAVGDRFGVFVEPDAEDPLSVLPAGNLANTAGKIATVSTTAPLAYTFYTPTEPYAFSVTGTSPVLNTPAVNAKSPHFGHSYTFRGTWGTGSYGTNYKWIEFAGPSMLIAGAGLKYAGSVLNVGAGPGIISNADTVQLDTTYANGIYVRLDGSVAMTGNLQLGGFKITNVAIPTVGTDAANKTYADQQDALRVAKTGDSMSGTLTFTAGTVTGLAAPSVNSDAATKLYADNGDATRVNRAGDTMNGTLVMSGVGVGIILPNAPVVGDDAVNKTYADTKLALAGGTLVGPLTLFADPSVPFGAATKQYVDNNFVAKAVSTTMNTNVNVIFSGTGEVLGLPATPSDAGSATSKAYVDAQDALKATDTLVVHTAGTETVTGAKTFSAATAFTNQVTVAADNVNTNLLITSTNITLTGTPVTSGGASNITATAGSNTAGVGGNIALAGGNGATNGGNITIVGGQGSAGNGGNITITTGTGTTTNGQLGLVAGLASITLNPTGVISVGGAIPTAKSQALVSNSTNPTTATPTWQLVGTRVASAPANSGAAGVVGNWFADDSFFYVYGATGWRRTAISTF